MNFDDMTRRIGADLDARYADYDLGAAREDLERRVFGDQTDVSSAGDSEFPRPRQTPSFEDFAATHVVPLMRYATVLTCDPHLAQDVVQDALLRAWQRWDRVGRTPSPAAYVKRMVTNEYLSWRRRNAARGVAAALAALEDLDATPQRDDEQAVLTRLAQLPRKQRAAVVLRYYEQYSDAEIAGVLGCAEGAVRSYIARALITLRPEHPLPPTSSRLADNATKEGLR